MKLSDATAVRPLWSLTNASLVLDYPFIRLADEDADVEDAIAAGEEVDEKNWVLAGDGWVALLSGGTGHRPVVTMEAWEQPPPRDGGRWQREHELRVKFSSGTLGLSSAEARMPAPTVRT